MLVGNLVGVYLTLITIFSFAPFLISPLREQKTVLMVVNPLWRGLGILGFTQPGSTPAFAVFCRCALSTQFGFGEEINQMGSDQLHLRKC